ncbi:MAG TPA: HAMP domain-containing sensor histidine kinase [Chloroflexota bacterium]
MRVPTAAPRRRRTLPIRRWLVLALIITVLVPVIVTAATALSQLYPTLHAQDEAPLILRAGARHWTKPAWQTATRAAFAQHGIDFVLIEQGHEVYRTSADPLAGTDANHQRSVQQLVVGGTRHQMAYIYFAAASAPASIWSVPLVALATLILTLVAIGWFLRWTLIKPLAATSDAARRIAAGDLTIKLPTSRVREVAQLNAAFLAMSDELRESLYRQAALEEERRLFVSAIAHDLRTPLFSLRGYLEGLEQGVATTPQKVARYIKVCREKADALERLIADLFAYTRVEYLEGTLQHAPLDLGMLLRKVVEGRQREAEADGVRLKMDEPARACMVEGDEQLLGRVVENLLDNALRYTPPGGKIDVRWGSQGDIVQFTVADTGPGIAPRDLPHLFEPMYRADPSRSRETGGTGLGLAIARRIMRAHDGDLLVANQTTGGAIFTGSIPLLHQSVRAEPVTSTSSSR